ncbi:hypothetical protein PTKIN_Ptkin09bG0254400 [Pterospermum kingtungense]
MEDTQSFGHEHPLVLLTEEQMMSNQSGVADCSRCGEKMSTATCFSCVECGFYLHKECAEAPLEINHPFHNDHPLVLLQISPYKDGEYICDFCDGRGKKFVYHCSCGLDFHIKCALFTYHIAQNNLKDQLLEHVPHEDVLVSPENTAEELGKSTKCFACREALANYSYFSPDCGFHLHNKCADLPLTIDQICHKHPLALQFNSKRLSCWICGETQTRGLVYYCSPCNFALHIECLPPPTVDVKCGQHAFTLFRRRPPFICDACGVQGNYVGYICCSCYIIVHKNCISLPRVIRSKWHDDHFIRHKYFLEEQEEEGLKSRDCLICHKEVNLSHGSYFCSDCKFIFHVRCVTRDDHSYLLLENNEDEKSFDPITVIEKNDAGEATKVMHFLHEHELMLRDEIVENDKCCDGCRLSISASFYYCSSCDFFLHKSCAELPKMKHLWCHPCQKRLILTSFGYFTCGNCIYLSSGFGYECKECECYVCIRCIFALSLGALTCPGHQHPLFYYEKYNGQCSACCKDVTEALRCKDCSFDLCHTCFSLPTTARHKCDKHLLRLTYHDDNNYSECHYCDICEERRDPNHWFYHCATCDTSAHTDCVLGKYPYIKLGSRMFYERGNHPHHPLTLVKKTYYYPACAKCGKPCQDLSFECAESGCNYIVHWECRK